MSRTRVVKDDPVVGSADGSSSEAELITALRVRLLRRMSYWTWIDDKEDLAHDALIVLLPKLRAETLDEPDKAFGYLVGIAQRLAIASERKGARRKTDVNSPQVEMAHAATAGPEQLAADEELARLTRDLCEKLNVERDRLLVQKHYLFDQDRETVRSDMNLSPQQLYRLLYRVRSRLRSIAQPEECEFLGLLS